jgi:hypothetical protein
MCFWTCSMVVIEHREICARVFLWLNMSNEHITWTLCYCSMWMLNRSIKHSEKLSTEHVQLVTIEHLLVSQLSTTNLFNLLIEHVRTNVWDIDLFSTGLRPLHLWMHTIGVVSVTFIFLPHVFPKWTSLHTQRLVGHFPLALPDPKLIATPGKARQRTNWAKSFKANFLSGLRTRSIYPRLGGKFWSRGFSPMDFPWELKLTPRPGKVRKKMVHVYPKLISDACRRRTFGSDSRGWCRQGFPGAKYCTYATPLSGFTHWGFAGSASQ